MPDLVEVLDAPSAAVDNAGDDGGGAPAVRAGIVVDHAYKDDAAVVAGPRPGWGLVLTADVIAPLVDDPESFGAIAAANSLSDVYAMGGEPRFALNLAFFCDDKLPLDVLRAIQDGAAAVCARAGVAVVGGHTVRDPELKFGLSVTGEVALDAVWSNRRALAGQALILTKALGTGVLGQAIKAGVVADDELAAAIASMTTLNRDAMAIGRARGVTAATDVTGFGLVGHLRNILRGSGLAATLDHAALPLLPGFARHHAAGLVPGGSKTNRSYLAPAISWDAAVTDDVRERTLTAITDAQTSGGLLLCLPAAEVAAALAALRACGLPASRIGELHAPPADAPWLVRLI